MSSQTLSKTWKSIWWIPLTKGILATIAAVMAVLWSHQTMTALVVIVGIYAIIDSVMTLINAQALHGMAGTGLMRGWGIIGIIIGLILIIHPGFSLHVIAIPNGFAAQSFPLAHYAGLICRVYQALAEDGRITDVDVP